MHHRHARIREAASAHRERDLEVMSLLGMRGRW
jgi:hypothetical protein